MSRATDAAFDALHALVADSMTEELRRDLERARQPRMIPDPEDPEGKRMIANPEWAPLSHQLLSVIRAFLKDNGIDTPSQSKRFNGLVDQLQSLDLDEVGAERLQ